jgi:hypothetical protein
MRIAALARKDQLGFTGHNIEKHRARNLRESRQEPNTKAMSGGRASSVAAHFPPEHLEVSAAYESTL